MMMFDYRQSLLHSGELVLTYGIAVRPFWDSFRRKEATSPARLDFVLVLSSFCGGDVLSLGLIEWGAARTHKHSFYVDEFFHKY